MIGRARLNLPKASDEESCRSLRDGAHHIKLNVVF